MTAHENGAYVNPPPMVKRPFGNWGSTEWTLEVGPSGVNLQSNIPTGHGGFVGVYLDFGPLQQILADGQNQWSPHWREQIQAALNAR